MQEYIELLRSAGNNFVEFADELEKLLENPPEGDDVKDILEATLEAIDIIRDATVKQIEQC